MHRCAACLFGELGGFGGGGAFRYVWLYKNPHHAAALQRLVPTADALYEPRSHCSRIARAGHDTCCDKAPCRFVFSFAPAFATFFGPSAALEQQLQVLLLVARKHSACNANARAALSKLVYGVWQEYRREHMEGVWTIGIQVRSSTFGIGPNHSETEVAL